jgi:AraC-like DNA-binding protein
MFLRTIKGQYSTIIGTFGSYGLFFRLFFLFLQNNFSKKERMKEVISLFDWRSELNQIEADAIGDDIILLENPIITTAFDYPFKVDVVTAIICTEGSIKGFIDLKQYHCTAPALFIVLPDQILQYEAYSENFSGYFIVMSKKFTNSLIDLKDKYPLNLSVKDNPWIPLAEGEIDGMILYYKMLQQTIRMKDNPNRMQILKLLTQAFFMGLGYQFHKLPKEENKSKRDLLVEEFTDYVQKDYKKHRDTEFYASKLSLTPKYLSKVIKENTGMSATDWINSYVILEAKALLKSTDMTVQQISDELNFPSQSHFGKFFKRQTGLSPKEYKND